MSEFKRQFLSLQKKVAIIRAVDNAPPSKKKEIASEFSIPANTLSTVLKNQASIMCSETRGVFDQKRKRISSSEYKDMDEALLKWFPGARDQNVPVSGPLLLAKAKEFAEKLGNLRFQGSAGWLVRFKRRHKVILRSVSGESASVSQDVIDEWLSETLPELLKDYSPENAFNADETGSFWRLLPEKTFSFRGDNACGLWQLCLHKLGPCSFSAFFYVTLVTHVTPRDVRVPGLPQLITSRHHLEMSHLVQDIEAKRQVSYRSM